MTALGRQEHERILNIYGGELRDRGLTSYVARIGRRLVAQTDRSDAAWTFTILDTPVVNAFAVPGGYVYVTRGLLALANDEAELAGVLGHEIGHLVEGHNEERMRRSNNAGLGVIAGAILGGLLGGRDGAEDAIRLGGMIAQGALASYSQKQELQADAFGVSLLARAGYDAYAQAKFLEQLSRWDRLQSRIAGESYNPNRVEIFATHPSNAARIRAAYDLARRTGQARGAGRVSEDAYLNRIDGMVFGDQPDQGFIRGRSFSHPGMRFTFTAPEGFVLSNSPASVVATHRSGARIVLSGDASWGGRMQDYIDRRWLPMLAREIRITGVYRIEPLRLNGLDAAVAEIDFVGPDGPGAAELIAIRHAGHTIRLVGIAPLHDARMQARIDGSMRGFRPLSASEAARLRPFHLSLHRVRRGETAEQLARRMRLRLLPLEQFLTLNGYEDPGDLRAGDMVKIVR